MARIVVLGSGFAVPDDIQDNTHLVVQQGSRTVLIDSASNPIQRLRQGGIDFDELTDIILTHFHPDHVSGIPLFLMGMWLLGRRTPINLYGLNHTLERMKTMLGLYEMDKWPDFYPVIFHEIPEREMATVIDTPDLRILASPVKHLIPTMGLRVEFKPHGRVVAYSCDTEPCDQVARLGAGADLLFHEAAGTGVGHSSAEQAAQVAREAGAKKLYLIHYSASKNDPEAMIAAARKHFPGAVYVTQDFMVFDLD